MALWGLELLTLASSYGALLLAWAAWGIRSGVNHDLVLRTIWSAVIVFTVVTFTAFANFIWSGYIFTSLIARFICMSKAPRMYALVLPALVVLHIELIAHMDGMWPLTISRPLFLGWGAATAFAIAYATSKDPASMENIGPEPSPKSAPLTRKTPS